VEHLLRDLPVQAAHGIAVGRGIEGEHGHGKPLAAVVNIPPSKRHQLLKIDADLRAVLRKVVIHQAGIE
jgi:hypothetical protein